MLYIVAVCVCGILCVCDKFISIHFIIGKMNSEHARNSLYLRCADLFTYLLVVCGFVCFWLYLCYMQSNQCCGAFNTRF